MEKWIETVGDIYSIQKVTHRPGLQETQLETKWEKWMLFWTKNRDNNFGEHKQNWFMKTERMDGLNEV